MLPNTRNKDRGIGVFKNRNNPWLMFIKMQMQLPLMDNCTIHNKS
jgi:hypothetical protein